MAEEIVTEVLWTPGATYSFQKIINYLTKEWSEKEVVKFVNRTSEMITMLRNHPEVCRPSLKRNYVRIGILDKHTQMVYYYKPATQKISILLFWGMKQHPAKFKY
jgi:plasmid stabilization system protein ParE